MTEMAISSYLGWLLLLMGAYPFFLVGVSMFFYDIERKHALRWLNGISFLLAAFLLYMHMQTEVIYGQELLEAWYRDNPEDRPQ
ncbi:hypothetical protein DC889_24860 [Vibrio parahaemolyticus]|uniref:hypothetical protein n=1 Tax=Vibrio parahaemolyticus TaxID=670 RepID=UPI00084BADB3|nr:hypothetical protein [Vibrio parahaemolyticus]EGR3203858.1 hypothetical protein [Vibrio parahaemolyticus]ODY28383.1 hypothetical protein BBM18_02205 [Vibrio parahaemolyticus]